MLMQSPCGPDTPLQFAEMTPTSVALGNLPTGNYFMVLTGEPKTPGTGCGIAVVFSNAVYSDVIFTNGFQ
jgi:hypothetical protein